MRKMKTIYPSSTDGAPGSRRAVHRHVPGDDDTPPAGDQIAAVLGRAAALSKTDAFGQSSDHHAAYDDRGRDTIVATHRAEAGDGNPFEHVLENGNAPSPLDPFPVPAGLRAPTWGSSESKAGLNFLMRISDMLERSFPRRPPLISTVILCAVVAAGASSCTTQSEAARQCHGCGLYTLRDGTHYATLEEVLEAHQARGWEVMRIKLTDRHLVEKFGSHGIRGGVESGDIVVAGDAGHRQPGDIGRVNLWPGPPPEVLLLHLEDRNWIPYSPEVEEAIANFRNKEKQDRP